MRILVTGATGSIGEAIVKEYANNGYFVYVHYNSNKEKANQLFEQAVEIFRTLPNRQKSLATTLRNYAATNKLLPGTYG